MSRGRWPGTPRLPRIGLVGLLVAVVGWPAVATVLSRWMDDGLGGVAGGLLDAAAYAGEEGLAVGPAWQTVRVVWLACAIALPVGAWLATTIVKTNAAGRWLVSAALGVGLFVPMPLYAAGWLGSYGNAGRSQAIGAAPILVGWTGAAFVHAMAAIPWVALIVGVGLRGVEPELEDSARMDRPGWWVLWNVTLRRSLGAVMAAGLAVAVQTAGDMTVTDLLQVRTYAEEAYVQFGLGRPPWRVGLVALPSAALLGALVGVGGWSLSRVEPARWETSRRRGWKLELGRRGRWALGLVTGGLVGVLAGLPVYGLVWRAGRVAGTAFSEEGPRWSAGGLGRTLVLSWDDVASPLGAAVAWSCVGATISAGGAWAIAWVCRESRGVFWPWLAMASAAVMLAVPGPVAGMSLVMAYRDVAIVYETPAIVVMGYVVRSMPLALLILWPAVRLLPGAFLDSARVDGVTGWKLIARVALPWTVGPLAAAWAVAFVTCLGELPITNLVSPPGVTVVSQVVWTLLHTGVESHLAGVGLILLAVYGSISLAVVSLLRWQFDRTESAERVSA